MLHLIRKHDSEGREIKEGDDSHIVEAKVLDSEDTHSLWVELNAEKHRQDSSVRLYSVMVPWNVILMICMAEEFAPHFWKEARKAGFITERTNVAPKQGLIIDAMPSKQKINLAKVRASLDTICTKCGCTIPPDKLSRVDTERVECPECHEKFVPECKNRPTTTG